jgi:hypothetical protein
VSERGRRTHALLRTLYVWIPPASSRPLATQPGFAAEYTKRGAVVHYITCPDCLTNDQPGGMVGCETCGGRGEIPDPRPDPYRNKVAGFYADETRERQREESRRRDNIILELEEQDRVRRGLAPVTDQHLRIHEEHDLRQRHGSYAELTAALTRLHDVHPPGYHLCLTIAHSLGDAPIEPLVPALDAACELLASWMPDPIRVPYEVAVWTRDELERQAAGLRERAQWRGRKDPLARIRRNLAIRTFANQGMSAAQIAERIGVHRRTVERVLSRGSR